MRFFRVPAWVYELFLDSTPLPLQLRRARGDESALPAVPIRCSSCNVAYLPRPTASATPENGQCYRCATGQDRPIPLRLQPPAPSPTVRQFDASRKLKGKGRT